MYFHPCAPLALNCSRRAAWDVGWRSNDHVKVAFCVVSRTYMVRHPTDVLMLPILTKPRAPWLSSDVAGSTASYTYFAPVLDFSNPLTIEVPNAKAMLRNK